MKVIALVDCNSFYCSCERLFRPDLNERPVGVLSNNDGCFVSRTNELKALGVKMGEPYFKVKDLCRKNNVAVFSANFSLYTNISDRVMFTLSQFAPEVEIYSVDEAFLDLTGVKNVEQYCRHIKYVIDRHIGIPVSIGIARTKTLAKIANHIAKKNEQFHGVFSCLEKNKREWALEKTSVDNIWGIGRQSTKKLHMINIKTAKQFRDYKNDSLIQKTFTKVGRQTQDELREILCFDLTLEIEKKKEIISSRTFGAPVFDKKSLLESVANYASTACEKLREQKSVCRKVEVWVRTNPFKDVEQYYAVDSYTMLAGSSDTRRIIKHSWEIIDKLYRQGFEYKKALVRISSFQDQKETQLSLFEETDQVQSEALMKVIDDINRREGPHTIKSFACGVNNKAWKMRQTLKSQRYVTGWNELPKVK